ncbi:unnamed protein product [Boreogadus saida]
MQCDGAVLVDGGAPSDGDYQPELSLRARVRHGGGSAEDFLLRVDSRRTFRDQRHINAGASELDRVPSTRVNLDPARFLCPEFKGLATVGGCCHCPMPPGVNVERRGGCVQPQPSPSALEGQV